MYLIFHFLATVLCTIQCLLACRAPKKNFIKIMIFLGIGIIHGLIPMLTPHDRMWAAASDEDITLASFLTFLGVTVFAVGYRLADLSFPRDTEGLSLSMRVWVASDHGQRVLKRMFWVCLFAGPVAMLTHWHLEAGSISAYINQGRFESRFQSNLLGIVLFNMRMLILVPGLVCFLVNDRLKLKLLGVIYAIMMAGFIIFATKGTRGFAISILGASMFGYVLASRVTFRWLLTLIVMGVMISIASIGIYETRKTMSRDSVSESLVKLIRPETYEYALERDPLNNHQFFVAAVHYFPDEHPYLNGATYRRIALFWLPGRYSMGLKPTDTHVTFGAVVTESSNQKLATIPPTLFGDAYINFWGIGGVLGLMFVNGFALSYIAYRISTGPLALVTLGAYSAGLTVVGLRGQAYEFVVSSAIMIAVCYVLFHLCGYRREQFSDFG